MKLKLTKKQREFIKKGNVCVLTPSGRCAHTYRQFIEIYAWAIQNGFTDVNVHFIDPRKEDDNER